MPHRKVLVLGSGGREHALCWHLKKFGDTVECAPGSDGIASVAECWSFSNFDDLGEKIKSRGIEIVIVGPEKYLAEGVSDVLQEKGISVFGPAKEAARLESNKSYAKDFCVRHRIPTARSIIATNSVELQDALKSFRPPFVVKASGLAAGKGVWIGESTDEAQRFGESALQTHASVVVEEFLKGEEVSFFAMIDGENFLVLGGAQDHKRLLENDQGPNTGGMGAYSPVPLLTDELQNKIIERVLKPTIEGLRRDKIAYRGFLFLGLMIVEGEPYLLEYNCRMGDPETQPLMLRLETPLIELIKSLAAGTPKEAQLSSQVALNVVIAAKGYPDNPKSGFVMSGLETVPSNCLIFHSGTKKSGNGWIAQGGRLFSVNTIQQDLFSCQQAIYPWIESLSFLNDVTYRKDIAVKAYTYLRNR